jgi:hypothetical protein
MATERVAAERGLDGDGDGEGQGVLRPGEEESAPLRGEEDPRCGLRGCCATAGRKELRRGKANLFGDDRVAVAVGS